MKLAKCPNCDFSMMVRGPIPAACPVCGNTKPPEAFVPLWRKVAVYALSRFLGLFYCAGAARNGRRKGARA